MRAHILAHSRLRALIKHLRPVQALPPVGVADDAATDDAVLPPPPAHPAVVLLRDAVPVQDHAEIAAYLDTLQEQWESTTNAVDSFLTVKVAIGSLSCTHCCAQTVPRGGFCRPNTAIAAGDALADFARDAAPPDAPYDAADFGNAHLPDALDPGHDGADAHDADNDQGDDDDDAVAAPVLLPSQWHDWHRQRELRLPHQWMRSRTPCRHASLRNSCLLGPA